MTARARRPAKRAEEIRSVLRALRDLDDMSTCALTRLTLNDAMRLIRRLRRDIATPPRAKKER